MIVTYQFGRHSLSCSVERPSLVHQVSSRRWNVRLRALVFHRLTDRCVADFDFHSFLGKSEGTEESIPMQSFLRTNSILCSVRFLWSNSGGYSHESKERLDALQCQKKFHFFDAMCFAAAVNPSIDELDFEDKISPKGFNRFLSKVIENSIHWFLE